MGAVGLGISLLYRGSLLTMATQHTSTTQYKCIKISNWGRLGDFVSSHSGNVVTEKSDIQMRRQKSCKSQHCCEQDLVVTTVSLSHAPRLENPGCEHGRICQTCVIWSSVILKTDFDNLPRVDNFRRVDNWWPGVDNCPRVGTTYHVCGHWPRVDNNNGKLWFRWELIVVEVGCWWWYWASFTLHTPTCLLCVVCPLSTVLPPC